MLCTLKYSTDDVIVACLRRRIYAYSHGCSEWDQPPEDMRPPDSVPIKVIGIAFLVFLYTSDVRTMKLILICFQDYAIETPLKKSASSSAGDSDSEVKIDFTTSSISLISAIYFVLKVCSSGDGFSFF